jgi:hypothetical protein
LLIGTFRAKNPARYPVDGSSKRLISPLDALVLAPLRRSCGGAYMAITDWRLYADPALAPLRRSSRGAITPITDWCHYGDR